MDMLCTPAISSATSLNRAWKPRWWSKNDYKENILVSSTFFVVIWDKVWNLPVSMGQVGLPATNGYGEWGELHEKEVKKQREEAEKNARARKQK